MTTKKPLLVFVTGVSGSGKSTLASAIAKKYDFVFLEADNFHSEANKAHMASGKALTDEMRLPWIKAMKTELEQQASKAQHCSLAFSGLRREHRKMLELSCFTCINLFLKGDSEQILPRMQARSGHFMPPSLLQSQFDALESPEGEPGVYCIDISNTLENNIAKACDIIEAHLP